MKEFWALNTRNVKIYFKDRSAVFFSLLSMFIVIMLMVFFLGDVSNDAILSVLKDLPGRDAVKDSDNVSRLVYLWTVAGIITINAASVTHAFFSNMIKDRNENRLNSILVMPIKRNVIVSAYVFGAWFVSVIMGTLTLVITEVIGISKGLGAFSGIEHIRILGLICVNSFVYASIIFFLASIVKSENAWGGIGIVLGTLSGFLGGIYLSIGSLSEGVVKVIKCFPFIYGTSVFRQIMLGGVEDKLFDGTPEIIRQTVDLEMGMKLTLFEKELSAGGKVGILVIVGLIFMFISTLYLTYSKKKDR